ncbi:MAG: 4'-phosphopantetheinyl transferase superfamily protein [Proteobacteria bacterium]|nr:4'-phosphopantetheinyl transferase superfamily protein [Pseudomonadota bacterium]
MTLTTSTCGTVAFCKSGRRKSWQYDEKFEPYADRYRSIGYVHRMVPQRRHEFLEGRRCAYHGIRLLGEQNPWVGRDETGAPVWPEGLTGSISHCPGLIAAVVGRTKGRLSLGLDVERIGGAATADILRHYCVAPEDDFDRGATVYPSTMPFIVFSLKEAIFKATFSAIGQHIGFKNIHLPKIDLMHGLFRWTTCHSKARKAIQGSGQVWVTRTHVISLCSSLGNFQGPLFGDLDRIAHGTKREMRTIEGMLA